MVDSPQLLESNLTQESRLTVSENGFNTQKIIPDCERLIINKMVLHNFKSYAGIQEVGPFHKSFSAVVGPNGSGKSNVIDSLLFVFGYRANKMRQAKLSELIHTSKAYPYFDSCYVEVHFIKIIDKGLSTEFISGSELVIKRVAYRNNTSKYYINSMQSSYTEVTDLLRNRGIDLDHKRFLILQGEVESISQMKPKALTEHDDGLLEYLEDIIGTSQYKDKIESVYVELEKSSDERQEKFSRMKIVEKEKNSLSTQKDEAVSYLEAENELIRNKNVLFQYKRYQVGRHIDECQAKLSDIISKLEEETEKNIGTIAKTKELEVGIKSKKAIYEVIDAKLNEATKAMEQLNHEDILLQENDKHIMAKLKKLKLETAQDRVKLDEQNAWLELHKDDTEKNKSEIEQLENKLLKEEKALSVIVEELKGKTEGFSLEIEEKQKQLAPWNEKINKQQILIDVEQSKFNLINNKKTAYDEKLLDYKRIKEELEGSFVKKGQELGGLNVEYKAIEERISDSISQLDQLKGQEKELSLKAQNSRTKFNEAQDAMLDVKASGKVLEALMREKELGRLRGIHGRLGNLGAIDAKYDVAVSTACPQLDNIIVDTIETAQQCIKYLRDNNIGRATFMALNKLPQSDLSPVQTPQKVHRLFDLIKPKDPMYSQAFYKVLHDTLVANNLEQARDIGMGQKRRWRVVTLQGQMVEISGTMSGGGTRIMRGAMSSKLVDTSITPEGLAELKRHFIQADSQYNEARQAVRAAEANLEKDKAMLPQLKMKITKAEMDQTAMEQQIQDAKVSHSQLVKSPPLTHKDRDQMIEYKANISKNSKELATLKDSAKTVQAELDALKSKIMDLGGVTLKSQNQKIAKIKKDIDLFNQKTTKLQVTRDKYLKDIERINRDLSKADNEIEELHKKRKQIEEGLDELADKGAECQDVIDQLQQEKATTSGELNELKNQLELLNAAYNKHRTVEVELNNQKSIQDQKLEKYRRDIKYWDNELSGLALQPVDIYKNEDLSLDVGNPDSAVLGILKPEDLIEIDPDSLQVLISNTETKLQAVNPNLGVLADYRRKLKDYQFREKELTEATHLRDSFKEQYDGLRQQRLTEFMDGFHKISYKLKEMYQMITLGGNAELELVDSLDPFSEGIIFSVMPPKKSWKNISNLSGGEKTLSSLALVFALHHFKPTPLYVMDEIDAALDFRNVSIVANYIKDRTKDAQFIIISLRNNMFELADRLVGIYKTHDNTKSITIDPNTISMTSAT